MMSAKQAIAKLIAGGVPQELLEPLIFLLPYEPVSQSKHVGEVLAGAWSAWAAAERRQGRDPGALPAIPKELDDD
jgi:hypothetical protein